ncbi:hypothetical protein [Paenibacillus agricola]|uniref:DUF4177 domain-containing protein n=1 Tax=Paenibacillus agricola TaxID=2716264 RepID=A0ABX0J1W3_9BACL|nr:hypothetical protein [Paenibacillus agricola]NHN30322.1 hypothetical protein [Paenibacillus agricola]
MKKSSWEYCKAVNFNELQQLGQEGWELVSVTGTRQSGQEHESGNGDIFYLKRPTPSIREGITAEQRNRALAQRQGAQ